MKLSDPADVRAMYDKTAEDYSAMMDAEIQLPVYASSLGGLAERLKGVSGSVVDTSCGSGHLLERYRREFDPNRGVAGLDLSPSMVKLAQARLGEEVPVDEGDMRDLSRYSSGELAAVVSFFSLHHLSTSEMAQAFAEWQRVLTRGGQLLLATWEGEGAIDYGEHADLAAMLHPQSAILHSLKQAGLNAHWVEPRFEEEMGMNSLYILAGKADS